MFRPNRWIPFSKGGDYRKWYGNWEYLLDYLDNGAGFKACSGYRGSDENNFFIEGIVWTDLSSGKPSFRYFPPNCIASAAGPMLGIINSKYNLYEILGILNSKIVTRYTEFLCATMHFQWGDIAKLPIVKPTIPIDYIVKDCISISKTDWDSFETSWDFKRHPLI